MHSQCAIGLCVTDNNEVGQRLFGLEPTCRDTSAKSRLPLWSYFNTHAAR